MAALWIHSGHTEQWGLLLQGHDDELAALSGSPRPRTAQGLADVGPSVRGVDLAVSSH